MIYNFLDKIKLLGKFEINRFSGDNPIVTLGIVPSIKKPRLLIPMINKELFITSLSLYQPSLARARVLKKMTILATKVGLTNIAIKDKVYLKKNDDIIREIFKRDDLYYAIFTGTEGSHRKVTVQVMDEKGTILGYIKVADKEDISELLNNEAEILRDLSRLEIKNGLFPKVIYHGEIKGTRVLILDTLKSVHSTFSSRLSDKHINFLSEIFKKTARIFKYKESEFALQIRQRLRDLETERLETERLGDLYKRVMDYIEEKLGDEEMPFGLCHRDFTPWNTYFHDGQLYVFDWEYAKKEYPPILDIFHFIIQDGILVRHLKPEGLLKRVMKNGKWLNQYSRLVGIKENLIMPLLLCYLLDISLLYIEREKGHVKGNLEKVLETWKGVIKLIV